MMSLRRIASQKTLWVAVSMVIGTLLFAFTGGSAEDLDRVEVVSLSVPESVNAGTPVVISAVSSSETGAAEVQVINAYGRLSLSMLISSGVGQIELPAVMTQQAGAITVTSGQVSESFTVSPGDVAVVVAPLVGPRTIVADGQDVTMAVVLPTDRWGNMVADQTPISVEWQQPMRPGRSGDDTSTAVEITNGVAWVLLASGEVAGPAQVRATAEANSGEQVNAAAVRVDEVPGVVSDIVLSSANSNGLADGRSLVAVETDELFDVFGNQLSDGTIGHFVYDGPAGHGVVPGTVQNGVVRVELVAPDAPGTLTGHLELHGQESNQVSIEFAPAISSFDARLERVGNDIVLRIESALDLHGAFVADGTEVRWGDERTQIRRGAAEIRLPAALVAEIREPVSILGLAQLPTGGLS